MSRSFRAQHFSPKTIRLRTSFDTLLNKKSPSEDKTQIGLNKINFSMGKPYKFPEYQEASDTCYSPSLYENNLKKNRFRIQKLEKLQSILLEKNYKFKKACNTSYKSQKTQRFQKTIVAFEDLQQIESLSIRKLKKQSEEMIRLKEAQKIHEILGSNKQSSTIFERKGQITIKTPGKKRESFKRPYFDEITYHTPSLSRKKPGKNKNLSTIDYLNRTTLSFKEKDQSQEIDPWKVSPQMQIGIS